MRSIVLCVLALFATSTLGGCASSSNSPAAIQGRQAERVALVPLNVVIALPPELESSVPAVNEALHDYLEFHGKQVVDVGYRTAQQDWRRAMQEVIRSKETQSFENGARVYVRLLRERGEFDALIVPAIFLQNVDTGSGRTLARWDGARERVRIERHVPGATSCERGNLTKASSLLLKVFDAEGELVHSAQSGLELVEHIEVRHSEKGGGWRTCEWVADRPAIDEPDRLMEGIARGFDPFLPERLPEPPEAEPTPAEPKEAG